MADREVFGPLHILIDLCLRSLGRFGERHLSSEDGERVDRGAPVFSEGFALVPDEIENATDRAGLFAIVLTTGEDVGCRVFAADLALQRTVDQTFFQPLIRRLKILLIGVAAREVYRKFRKGRSLA